MNKINIIAKLADFGSKDAPVVKEMKSGLHYVYTFKMGDEDLGKHHVEYDTVAAIVIGSDAPLTGAYEEQELYDSLAMLIANGAIDVPISDNLKGQLLEITKDLDSVTSEQIANMMKKEIKITVE